MGHNHAVESAAHAVQGGSGALLDLLLESAREGSVVEDFLAGLARLAADEVSLPDHEVSCGITIDRRKHPSLAAGATGKGAASTLRIPLALDGDNSAVLTFSSARTFSTEEMDRAHQFAAAASPALLLALRISRLNDSRADLAAAMQSRTTIDIAIGAIMAQNRCGREAAFTILRNTSNNRNQKIRDVAASVVASIAGDTDLTARFEE